MGDRVDDFLLSGSTDAEHLNTTENGTAKISREQTQVEKGKMRIFLDQIEFLGCLINKKDTRKILTRCAKWLR